MTFIWAFGTIWDYLGLFGHLGLFGTIWAFGIWDLEQFWDLEHFGIWDLGMGNILGGKYTLDQTINNPRNNNGN